MAENLGLLNPYLVTGIGNNGAYNQPSQVGDIKLYCQAQVQILILLQWHGPLLSIISQSGTLLGHIK